MRRGNEGIDMGTPLRVGRKVSHTPFPTREELMKRNSFPGPDKNKYLNRMWGECKNDQ